MGLYMTIQNCTRRTYKCDSENCQFRGKTIQDGDRYLRISLMVGNPSYSRRYIPDSTAKRHAFCPPTALEIKHAPKVQPRLPRRQQDALRFRSVGARRSLEDQLKERSR